MTPQDTQLFLCGISKNLNRKLIIEFSHLLTIPITLFNGIMPYFDEFINVYGLNMSILRSPLKIWTPKNFTTANFRHPVSKSWLRHCLTILQGIGGSSLCTIWLKSTVVPCLMNDGDLQPAILRSTTKWSYFYDRHNPQAGWTLP